MGLEGENVAGMVPDGVAWITGPPASDRQVVLGVGIAAAGECSGEVWAASPCAPPCPDGRVHGAAGVALRGVLI